MIKCDIKHIGEDGTKKNMFFINKDGQVMIFSEYTDCYIVIASKDEAYIGMECDVTDISPDEIRLFKGTLTITVS